MSEGLLDIPSLAWTSPPPALTLAGQAVHLWKCLHAPQAAQAAHFSEWLSEQEKESSRRFVRPLDRERYVFFHGALRLILSRYIPRPPRDIVFEKNPFGKPLIRTAADFSTPIRFNLAHSGQVAIIAVAAGREIGVDVEGFREVAETREIVGRFFAPEEKAFLLPLPDDRLRRIFLIYWTCKEALAKAFGQGLALPFDQFSVSSRPGISPDGQGTEIIWRWAARKWMLLPFTAHPGFVGALADQSGSSGGLSSFQFEY